MEKGHILGALTGGTAALPLAGLAQGARAPAGQRDWPAYYARIEDALDM